MKPVTDPTLLEQLDQQPLGLKPVSDPGLLAELEGTPKTSNRPRWMDAAEQLMADTAAPAVTPGRESVLQDAAPMPFDFKTASQTRRLLDDQAAREAQFGTVGPIVGPKPTAWSVIKGLATDLVAGGKGARAGVNQMVGDLIESEYLQNQARKERGQADLMSAVNTPNIEGDTARGVYGGLSSLVRQTPALAAAIATRSPTVALGGMAAPMLPEEYGKFRQRGGTPTESLLGATGMVGTEVATEMLPMGFLVKQFGRAGAGQFLSGLLAREVPGEQVATLVQDAIDTAVANPDKTWAQYLQERPGAAYQTLIATLTQSGVMGAGNAAVNRLTAQPEPRTPVDVISRLMGQPTPTTGPAAATTAPAPTPPAMDQNTSPPLTRPGGVDQNALADRIIAAINGNQPEQTQALTDVFTNGQNIDTSQERVEKVPEIEQDVTLTDEGKTPILQNRNRATPSSIAQMQSIAGNPDYGRLGFSRDFANGAPVVAGGQINPDRLGRTDVAVASDGRRIPVQYAVVEASDVLASNNADGTPNQDYGNQAVQRIRAIAGNGRIAGLQAAHGKGTTKAYQDELTADTLHGVSPEVIRAMRAPVLVRVMPSEAVTDDIGDVSNTTGNLNLSPVEQANNDAQRVSLDALQFAEDGGITPETVRQFVRAMPQAEQGGLIDTDGQPTKQAVDRINAAVFAKAYGNDGLARLFAQAQDPEARLILSALAQVAPKMARLEGLGALDIREIVTQAAEIAVNARRDGKSLARAAQQMDMAADPLVGVVLQLFANNPRAAKPVVDSLGKAADFAYTEATKPAEDMFGEVPRASRGDVINQLRPENEQRSQENLEQPAGRGPVQVDAGRASAQPAATANPATAQASGPAEAEGLTAPTPDDIRAQQDRAAKVEADKKAADTRAEQEEARERERKEVARRSEAAADTFELGQDPMANLTGQQDVFSAAADPQETKPSAPRKQAAKIEDSGEVLEGARKLYAKSYAAKLDEGSGMNTASVPLSRSWPEPDYQRLIDEGADPWAVSMARAARDEVPAKPGKPWKLKGWVAKVDLLRGVTQKVMAGEYTKEQVLEKIPDGQLQGWLNKVDLYQAVGHANSLKDMKFEQHEYGMYGGQVFKPAKKLWTIGVESTSASATYNNGRWGNDLVVADTKAEAIEKFKVWTAEQAAKAEDSQGKPAGKRTEFHVYRYRNNPKVFIVGKRLSATKSIDLMEFESSKEAQAFIADNQDKLETMLAEAKTEQSERREENAPRVGADHRQGADVTTEQFRETFGFRGEQFGASMPQVERQANMNQAYDALMDLAGVIGVPPKSLSLNGELGLAFGARGHGGKNPAMAHYEADTTGAVTPNRVVINLTRKNGAGSLAHEWFHAVDNYFARMRGEKAGFLTESYPARRDGVRPEMVDAFKRVMDAIRESGVRERSKNLDKKRTKDYWSTGLEMAARSFESYVIAKLQDKSGANDYLANIVPESLWLMEGSYPYPTMGELPAIRDTFDNFFDTLQTRETEQGVMLYDLPRRQEGNPLDRLPEKAKANVRGRLDALGDRLENGQITDEQYAQGAQAILEQVAQRRVNRGPEWIQERLIRAKRKGELEAETVDFALWLLNKNPALATDLAVMVSDTKEPAAGDYNAVTETMRLFRSTASETTAVHEILHHTERMMPPEVQAGILAEYNRAWGIAYNKGNAKVKGLMRDMLMAAAGDKKAMDRVVEGFNNGTLDYDAHYSLFNPSEFWAVKASDILSNRYKTQGSWVAQAKQWLRELIQLMKGKLGMPSDAPIIKALEAVLKGDGTKFSPDILANNESVGDLAQGRDQTKTDAFKRWFGNSKVVDAEGKPLVVYHGTNADFSEFDIAKFGKTDDGWLGEGFYFSPRPRYASGYAKGDGANVMPVYLSMKNPFYAEGLLSDYWTQERLIDAGFDGVIYDGGQDGKGDSPEYVVFRPEQIKSATGNDGSFDPANPNILRDIPKNKKQSPNRDELGRVKFKLGEVGLGKLDAATRPLQERFGMRMASPELRKQLRKMKATIDQANQSATNVAKQMKDMSEADRAMVSDIVEKMIAPGVVPPEHAVRVADAITKTMDRQTDELVELGMLSQESADRWRGRYLPRIYNRKTELGIDSTMDAVKNMFKTGRPTGQGIGGGSLKGRGLFEDVSVDSVDQWTAMGYEVRDPHWKLVQGKLELVDKNAPKVAQEKVTVWRDWTPQERAEMGENRDALFRYVQGYTSMQRDIALGRLFNQIANNPDWVRRSDAKGWLKVPDTEIPDTGGVKRYGNLAGLYVRRDVMSHLTRFEESANEALQIWREALGIWKEGKTALNPVAHFNNISSNIFMAHFAGVSFWDNHKYVNAARDLVNDAPMVEEARNAGLFTGSYTKEELVNNMPPELQKMMQMEEGKLRQSGRHVMNALTFWLRTPLRNAYEFEDTYFKYLIYRDARQQGLNPEDATDYALRYIFTYDDLPSGARKVRDFAIPFFSWTYKAMPALLHTAAVYPWRFAAPAAMLHGINLVAYALAAGDEDDNWLEKIAKGRELEKEEREVLPERMQGESIFMRSPKSIRLGTDEVTGNPIFLDVSRVVPGGDMFDMENQAGGLPLPAPLMPNHPVLSAFAAMIANKEMFMGRELVDKNDTGLEAAEKRAKWMAGFLLPAVAPGGYHSQRILDATANAMDTVISTPLGDFTGVDRSGLPVQPKFAAMQTLGIKARPMDLDLEASRRKAQESALINSITAEVRSMARLHQRGAVSDEMMDRTREKAREKIDRMREE